jgi:hypothetical protein
MSAAGAPEIGSLAIPRLNAPPALDGRLDLREWACAALLPPPARIADGRIDADDPRIYLGWKDDALYVGVTRRIPAGASGAAAAQDQVAFELIRAGAQAVRFSLGPSQRAPLAGGEDWVCRAHMTDDVWEAEARLPLKLFGPPGAVATLTATPAGSGGGPATHRLTQRVACAALPVACRFVAVGPFPNGRTQGAEIELVNDGAQAVSSRVELSLCRGSQETARVDVASATLPANFNQRYRVVTPLAVGFYPCTYAVAAGDTVLAQGQLPIDSSGPIQVELVPYFLKSQSLLVRVTVPEGTNLSVRASLTDATGARTLAAATGRTDQAGRAEIYVSTKKVPPGPFLVRVEAGR